MPREISDIRAAVLSWDAAAHDKSALLPTDIANGTIKFRDTTLLVRQSWIDLKNSILSGPAKGKHILLRGKAGRGKSSFVSYLIFAILLNARWSSTRSRDELVAGSEEQEPPERQIKRRRTSFEGEEERIRRLTNPVITFVTHGDEGSVTIRLSLDDMVVCQGAPAGSHYYINDYVSGGNTKFLGSFLTMGVTSKEKQKERFEKNLAEEGGTKFMMLSPSIEELRLMFDGLAEEDLNRRIEVVGHNPRLLEEMGGNEDTIVDDEFFEVVAQAAHEALGEDHPHFSWAIAKVVAVLRAEKKSGAVGSNMTLSSMFLDYIPSNVELPSSAHCFEEVSASRFMSFVHGKLVEHFKSSKDETLKALFGSSGLGQCHEYDCHQFLLRMTTNQTHLCWSATSKTWMPLVLGPSADIVHDRRRIIHVRTIKDIAKLGPSDYGLPSICNYPLIDSVLKPCTTTQMTISRRHRGAVNKLGQIKESMDLGDQTMKMIFFVTENNIYDFVFPTELPNVDLYVTVPVSNLTMEKANDIR